MVNLIKKLREETGLGIMECKKALAASNGDYDKARDLAKKEALTRVKPGRETSQGYVACWMHHDGRIGAMVRLECETDFVSRSDEFRSLAKNIAMQVGGIGAQDTEELLKQDFIKGGGTVSKMVETYQGKCGENIRIADFVRYEVGGKFAAL